MDYLQNIIEMDIRNLATTTASLGGEAPYLGECPSLVGISAVYFMQGIT